MSKKNKVANKFPATGSSKIPLENNQPTKSQALFDQKTLAEIKETANDYVKEKAQEIIEETTKNSINEFQAKIIEILAIFVALFTFVSVDIQIFKSEVSFLSATGTSLITLGALIFFIFILNLISNPNKPTQTRLFLIPILLIIIGICLVGYDYKNYTKFLNENFYTKTEVNDKFIKREDFYSKDDLKSLIDENSNNKKILNCIKIKGFFTMQCFNQQ